MSIFPINHEWGFIRKGISFSNKGGTEKGLLLFELQVLLTVISKAKSRREKQILEFFYQKLKEGYRKT